MAINSNTIMDEGLKAKIDNYYAPNTIALLINDQAGNLDKTSTMSQVASKELPSGNGYERKQVNIPASSINNNNKAEGSSDLVVWTATGGNIPTFSHICFIVGGNTTVGDTSGTIDRILPVNNGTPIPLNNQEKYRSSFIQRESGAFANA